MKNYEVEDVLKYTGGKPFGIWISSLGHYADCGSTGKRFLFLPATKEEVTKAMQDAGIGNPRYDNHYYEEFFISDYDDYTHTELWKIAGEYADIDALNLLAQRIEEMNDYEYECFCEYCNAEQPRDLETLYAVAKQIVEGNVDINFYKDVKDDEDLGDLYINHLSCGIEELGQETKESYFDYEEFGRSARDTYEDEILEAINAENKSNYELGQAIADEFGIEEYDYENNFDYEGYGRDIRFNTLGMFSENGWIEYPDGAICPEGELEEDLKEVKDEMLSIVPDAKELNELYKKKYAQVKRDAIGESGRMEQEIKQEKHHSRNW